MTTGRPYRPSSEGWVLTAPETGDLAYPRGGITVAGQRRNHTGFAAWAPAGAKPGAHHTSPLDGARQEETEDVALW